MRSISAHNLPHGTTCSISSKNTARRVFFLYRSNPVIIASVLCLKPAQLYLGSLWKGRT
jgi:hypothetical protein